MSDSNRILFVDDEPHLLAGLRRMLQIRNGVGQAVWAMSFVDGGAAALEAMEAEPFDVVVSDFRMPGIDGAQLLAEVQVRYPQTVRLILSGYTEHRDLTTLAGLAHQFLTKPCDPGELKRTVEGTLALGRQCDDERVRVEMSGISILPSSPSTIEHLMELLDSASDTAQVTRALRRDVGLSAKVLQVVNSSFFAPGRRTTSLEEAVLRLDVGTIRSLATTSQQAMASHPPGLEEVIELQLLNDHALETGKLARRLAPPQGRDDAFCAGLLHVCGHLALIAGGPDALGVTAAQAGAYLLTLWGIPPEAIEAIACLSHPLDPARPDRPLDLVAALRIAHVLVESEHAGSCGWSTGPAPDQAWLEAAGIAGEVAAWKAERTERPA